MGVTVVPFTVSGSSIKSIQRGAAASSGTITITAVDTAKTFVSSFSDGSTGSVGATGTDSGTLSPSAGSYFITSGNTANGGSGTWPNLVGTRTFAAGATSLTAASFGVVLTNSTTLTADGASYWEVVEHN